MSFRNQAQVYDLQAYRLNKEAVHMNIKFYLRHRTIINAEVVRISVVRLMNAYGLKSIRFPKFRITVDRGDVYISAPNRRRSVLYDT